MCVGGFFLVCVLYILPWSVAVSCHLGLINNKLNRTEPVGILKMLLSCYPLLFSRAELLGLYEQVILNDIELSDSQNVDQALWKNVFYQVIERFRQLLKDPTCDNTPHIRNMLLTLLDEVRNVW